jgi:voltage-gated sodium channel
VFDVLIVVAVFLPIGSQYATVLRLARLLRVLRLIHAVPRLQILVTALLRSIPSMGYVSLLLLLVFYVYAVAGVFLFGANDPFRFGSLPIAFVTLFQVATAEDWSTTLYTQMYGCNQHGYDGREQLCLHPQAQPIAAPLYFISFILIGTMVILNLFIGVIMNSMTEAEAESDEYREREQRKQGDTSHSLTHELLEMEKQLHALQVRLRALSRHAPEQRSPADGPVGEQQPPA